jgi:hypothetical protein
MQGRLRLKIASRRGDVGYFSLIIAGLMGHFAFSKVSANHRTGSLLIQSEDDIDLDAVKAYVEKEGMFHVMLPGCEPPTAALDVAASLGKANNAVSRLSGGEMDLPTLFFTALVISGVTQLARGRFVAPPWYTAFWYAMGLFSKSIGSTCEKCSRSLPPGEERPLS